MRATPPAARMSAGTRSSAITATAPASSAILAWSGVTTSMMTPPLSIWARPFLVAQVDVSTVMWAWIPLVARARIAGRVWPRGRRPFESAEPLARPDYRTSAAGFSATWIPGPDSRRHGCRTRFARSRVTSPDGTALQPGRPRTMGRGFAMRKFMVLPMAGLLALADRGTRRGRPERVEHERQRPVDLRGVVVGRWVGVRLGRRSIRPTEPIAEIYQESGTWVECAPGDEPPPDKGAIAYDTGTR